MKSIRLPLGIGLLVVLFATAGSAVATEKIILIGGKKSHGPAQHDFPHAIPLLAAQIKASPTFAGIEVESFPSGFPADLTVLQHASTLILYFDGVQEKPAPLLDPARIKQVQTLMDAGTGLICLHQASSVPPGNTTIPMTEWLGARRNGMADRVQANIALKPATPSHPICTGLGAFSYEDEFYPTLIFTPDMNRVTPVLLAAVPPSKPRDRVVAWAFDRANGGRSFGFTGGHYLSGLTQPQIKKMILNAIAWTAHVPVPPGGVESAEPASPPPVSTSAPSLP